MAKVTHVLFDLDGTLIDSVDLGLVYLEEILARQGKHLTNVIRDYLPNMTSFSKLIEVTNQDLSINLNEKEVLSELFFNIYQETKLLPGVEKLVKHLNVHSIPMAVATGNSRKIYEKLIPKFGSFFPKYFSHCVCAKDDPDVPKPKPHPDVYWVAAKKFLKPPESMENVLIFEDSITGLQGSTESGGKSVFIYNGKFKINDQERSNIVNKADLTIESLDKFDPTFFNLPPY